MDEVDRAIATLKPDSWKGYTVGDNTTRSSATHPWRMDDEKLIYPFYEKIAEGGLTTSSASTRACFRRRSTKQFPASARLLPMSTTSARRRRTGRSINFVIYHSAYRLAGGAGALAKDGYAQFEQTGRVEWVSDLAEIPAKYGVSNVYADLGQIFAQTTVVEPRLCAALMGMLIKGMGADHVVWGTDAVWTGAPQWQIEALRRLEIPEEMRRKHGFAELGAADGPVKRRSSAATRRRCTVTT